MKKWLKNQKGLTLVELLAVIVILGIIAAIAVPAIGNIIENSRKDSQIANAEALYDAARLAQAGDNLSGDVTFIAVENGEIPTFDADSVDTTSYSLENYIESSFPESDSFSDNYINAEVAVLGGEYTIKLEGPDGHVYIEDTIQEIRSEGRDAVTAP